MFNKNNDLNCLKKYRITIIIIVGYLPRVPLAKIWEKMTSGEVFGKNSEYNIILWIKNHTIIQ